MKSKYTNLRIGKRLRQVIVLSRNTTSNLNVHTAVCLFSEAPDHRHLRCYCLSPTLWEWRGKRKSKKTVVTPQLLHSLLSPSVVIGLEPLTSPSSYHSSTPTTIATIIIILRLTELWWWWWRRGTAVAVDVIRKEGIVMDSCNLIIYSYRYYCLNTTTIIIIFVNNAQDTYWWWLFDWLCMFMVSYNVTLTLYQTRR